MLVLDMSVQVAGGRLENVSGGHAARGDAPSAVLEQERGFRLRTSKTELAGIARNARCRVVSPQCPESFGNGGIVQPFDLGRCLTEDGVQAVRLDELDRAGAVF